MPGAVGSESGVQATGFYWRWRLEVISMWVTCETGGWAEVDRERGPQSKFWAPQDEETKEMRGASKGGRGGDAGGRRPRPRDPLEAEERVVCVDRPWAVSEVGTESRLTPEALLFHVAFQCSTSSPPARSGKRGEPWRDAPVHVSWVQCIQREGGRALHGLKAISSSCLHRKHW